MPLSLIHISRYLAGLNQKIDDHEKVTIQGELGTGIFVNAASVIMRLGVATTILVLSLIHISGQVGLKAHQVVNAPAGVVPAQLHHGVGLPPCLGVPEAPGL